MFRIRRIYDDVLPVNRSVIAHAQEILRVQFPALAEKDIAKLPEQLTNPLKYQFQSILFAAEGSKGDLQGFALLLHEPQLHFGYLEYISAAARMTGRGIGGALYERLREEARALGMVGIFFECLPDDPALCRDPEILKQNKARLKFYEKYGAHPLAGTAYETPVTPGDDNPPYLVFDPLGQGTPLPRATAQAVVRAILERKYAHLCPRSYIEMVVASIVDDPVQIRPARYFKQQTPLPARRATPTDRKIALVVNDKHDIHHIRERGYVESPVRIRSILKEISRTDLFEAVKVRNFSEKHIRAVHDAGFVDYLKAVCAGLKPKETVYPYFSGFDDEKGSGAGAGFNLNLPLGEHLDGAGYRQALEKAIRRITRFKPQFLVIALGLDTAKGDPTGTWNLLPADFEANGRALGTLQLPTLVVQEGGYDSKVLGINARRFFTGLWSASFGANGG